VKQHPRQHKESLHAVLSVIAAQTLNQQPLQGRADNLATRQS